MNRLAASLLLSLSALLSACGGGGSDSPSTSACDAAKIIGGETCSAETSPVVLLNIDNRAVCSSVIISSTSLLTAAHCVVGASAITAQHASASEQVIRAVYNGKYPGGVNQYDMAVLQVSTAFTQAAGVAPLPLSLSEGISDGDLVVISGYGANGDEELDPSNPKAAYLYYKGEESGLIVAEEDTGLGRPGDSGGPLVYNGALLGIFSGYLENDPINFFSSVRNPSNLALIRASASGFQTALAQAKELELLEWSSAE
jgi:hypothetical protein